RYLAASASQLAHRKPNQEIPMTRQRQYDVLVIGSGAAGLTLALHLADNLRIAVISKGQLSEGSTFWAQGGVAAVLDDADTVDAHVQDTLIAGGEVGRASCREEGLRSVRAECSV